MKSRIRGGDAARAPVAMAKRLPVPLQTTDVVGPHLPVPAVAGTCARSRRAVQAAAPVRKPSSSHDVIYAPTNDIEAHRAELRAAFGDIPSSNIYFEGEHVTQSIDEALTASEGRGGGGQTSSKEDAAEFLVEILTNGPVDVLEVERQARAATLFDDDKRLRQNKVFRDARKALGALSIRTGFGPGARYVLGLPGNPCAPKISMCAHAPEGAHMNNPSALDGTEGSDEL